VVVRAAEEAGGASGGANDDVAAGEGFTEDSNKLGRGSEGSEGSEDGVDDINNGDFIDVAILIKNMY
jgi:hypothetical protein